MCYAGAHSKEAAGLHPTNSSKFNLKKTQIFVDLMISMDLRNLPFSQTQLLKPAITSTLKFLRIKYELTKPCFIFFTF